MALPFLLDPNNRPGQSLFSSMMVPPAEPLPTLVNVPAEKPGILGRIGSVLANPAVNQRLMALGSELLANSGYQTTPVTTGAGLGRGLMAMNQAGMAYDEMIAKQAADRLNKRLTEAQIAKAEQEAKGGGSRFGKGAGVGVNPDTNKPEVYQLSDAGEVVWTGVSPAESFTYQDLGGEVIGAGKYGGKGPQYGKGVSPDVLEKERQRIREEQRAPEVAAATTAATEAAKAETAVQADREAQVVGAQEALSELTKLENALGKLPKTPAGMKVEEWTAKLTGGDPEVQAALGEVAQVSGRMLKYVERLPGAATDKDRDTFMASAGVINNEKATIQARLAAVRSAKESYNRLINKYGKKAEKPQGAPAAKPKATTDLRAKYGL